MRRPLLLTVVDVPSFLYMDIRSARSGGNRIHGKYSVRPLKRLKTVHWIIIIWSACLSVVFLTHTYA